MTKIIKKSILIFIFLIISSIEIFSDVQKIDCELCCESFRRDDRIYESILLFSLPEGWSLPKQPKITIKNSKNIEDSVTEKMIQVGELTYKITLKTRTASSDNDGELEISMDIPMCSDICTIVSKKIVINCGKNQPIVPARDHNIVLILLFAFLGGLILNIMPCVLPVILLKMRSFVATEKITALTGTIIGNYTAFMAFAAFIAFVKLGGEQVGWGMHFQNPYFLKVVAIFLFLLMLYGFEIILIPIAIKVSSEKRQVFFENMVSAIVASIIAIPCTAPMLGTAATFAIQGTMSELFMTFFVIATGFSFPYIAAFFVPISLPKLSGRLSVPVKNVINWAVGVALIWILLILSNHIGFWGVAVCCVLMAISAYLFYKMKSSAWPIILLIPILFLPKIGDDCSEYRVESSGATWIDYRQLKNIDKNDADFVKIISNELANNRIIILNISADWCLTCKYNEANVLNKKEMHNMIIDKNILCIRGDITTKDDRLMKFINDRGRVGIPFTMVFGPNAKDGILLPEIFSFTELKEAISKATLPTQE